MLLGSARNIGLVKFVAVLLLATGLVSTTEAQYRSPALDRKTSPRALGVVQQLPNGSMRLFPVSIFLDGKFYDARFYSAKPVPLALYDETVYIALKDGMPTGEFTVHTAQQVPETSIWWGIGDWKPTTGDDEKKPVALKNSDKDSDRPILKKSGQASPDQKDTGSSTKSSSDASASGPQIKPDNDSDRPVLRKPKAGEAEPQVKITTADMSPKPPPEDPNRPVLSRKKPVGTKEEAQTITAPKMGIKGAKYLVAISDPDTMNNRPYEYTWSGSEKTKWTEQMSKIGMEAARKYASTSTKAQLLPTAKFAESQLRAVDLDYSNAPYLIFTGQIDPTVQAPVATSKKAALAGPPQLATFYVTVVARLNSQGELNRLLAVATDSAHLDLNPRLELVDAVDADGDNRAELLFRKMTDTTASYVIYRMTPFQMDQVFEGGSGN
jgi:hypothetical protein